MKRDYKFRDTFNNTGMTWMGGYTQSVSPNFSLAKDILEQRLMDFSKKDKDSKLESTIEKEYERSWLIQNPAVVHSGEFLGRSRRLWTSVDPEVRWSNDHGSKFYKTEKSNKGGVSTTRIEKTTPLSPSEWASMWRARNKGFHKKSGLPIITYDTMKVYNMPDGSLATIRKYPNGKSFIIGEREFPSKKDADNFVIPAYGKDITFDKNYRGVTLAYNNRKIKDK